MSALQLKVVDEHHGNLWTDLSFRGMSWSGKRRQILEKQKVPHGAALGKAYNLLSICDAMPLCRIKTFGLDLGSDSMYVWDGVLNDFLWSCRYILWVQTRWAAMHSGICQPIWLQRPYCFIFKIIADSENDESGFFQTSGVDVVRKQTFRVKCRGW